MIVKCKFNKGKDIPSEDRYFGHSIYTEYGLELEKDYFVMGIISINDEKFYLLDDGDYPSIYPINIFKIIDNNIPTSWFKNEYENENGCIVINSFKEMCDKEDFLDKLLDFNEQELKIYYNQKEKLYPRW